MRCVRPVNAFRALGGGITFARSKGTGIPVQVRCGQCVGCRLSYARSWAVRIMCESQLHPASYFLTLTYDEENLPPNGSLHLPDFQAFVKRLRRRIEPARCRYFACGEYGGQGLRPHYHTVLFGPQLVDLEPWSNSGSGHQLERSPIVEESWGMGHALVGSVTFESAQYVAKYATKKLNVSKASSADDRRRWEARYERYDSETGEVVQVDPEFVVCSTKPGIGAGWFERFGSDVYPWDEVVMDGKVHPPPRYFDRLLERSNPELLEEVKRKRQLNRDRKDDSSVRLESLETCANARLSLHKERD